MYSFLSGFVHSAWVFWDSSVLLCVNSSFVFNRWCVFYYMGIPSVVYPSPVLQHWSVFQGFFFNFFKKFYLLIYLWLCWVFVSVRGLSPVAESGGYSSSRRAGLSLSRPLLLREHRLQTRRLSNCGSRAQSLRGTRGPPRPGLEPASPASAGRLPTTAPPGKLQVFVITNTAAVHIHVSIFMRTYALFSIE